MNFLKLSEIREKTVMVGWSNEKLECRFDKTNRLLYIDEESSWLVMRLHDDFMVKNEQGFAEDKKDMLYWAIKRLISKKDAILAVVFMASHAILLKKNNVAMSISYKNNESVVYNDGYQIVYTAK
jgi:hypothetical protein